MTVMVRLLLAPLLAAVCSTSVAGPSTSLPTSAPPTAVVPTTPTTVTAPTPRDADVPGSAVASGDACPNEVETRNGFQDDDGCADALPADLTANLGVVSGIVFDLGKATLRLDRSQPTLDRLIDALTRHPGVAVEIAVHNDDVDLSSRGRCLPCERAQAIADHLVRHGIDRARVQARGYGRERPISHAPGQPRRIEVNLLVDGRPVAPSLCIGDHTSRGADGEQRCYPYLCRAGACLTRCVDRSECAGAQVPAELATKGWPLECMPSGECTPMPPDKVH
jgi:outer membrane protein OmpA-like peptidoglycan-associated protein